MEIKNGNTQLNETRNIFNIKVSRLYILGDQGHFTELNRHKLFPVMTVGN